jgi:hypothetical protein
MRLSVFVRRGAAPSPVHDVCDVALMLANRTVVVWDSGERESCRSVGESLLSQTGEGPDPLAAG